MNAKTASLPKNIVAIDDSLTLRKFIESVLSSQPFVKRLVLAENARKGLELISNLKPDLVICDLTMPDMRGDELCEAMLHNPLTNAIPVILMSSEGEEIAAIQKRLQNIQHVIVKPFTRQLLTATVGYVISSQQHAKSAAATVDRMGEIIFRGSSSTYPLAGALRAIAKRRLTGILRVAGGDLSVDAMCRDGAVVLVTTRDVKRYLENTPYHTSGRRSPLWLACEEKQRETLCPFLFNLADLHGLAELTASTLSEFYGQQFFARLWREVEVSFEFEEEELPAFTKRAHPTALSMDAWILQTLRYVDQADEMTRMVEDPNGVPVLTPLGFRKLSEAKPDRAEKNILSLLNGTTSLAEICGMLHITPSAAAHRIFCYRQLGFVDYWPSSLLENNSA